MRSWLNPLLFLCCALCMTQPHAQTPDTREPLVQPSLSATGHDSIPESLQPWIPWVLKGHEDLACPLLTPGVSGRDAERLCAWPGRLRLSLDQGGASFDQEWEVMAPSWVPLPGEAAHWPLEVLDGDRPQPVLERQGRPMVHLAPGTHRLSGRLPWSRPPESLAIPPEVVLLELSGAPHPHRDPQGRLWFERPEPRTEPRAPSEPERLTLEVMRHIEDSIPLRITTRLVLDVSGAPREVSLGQPMLEHSRPLRLLSPLPTRLDAQGQLRLQVRPGRWELTLESYQPEPVDALALAPRAAPWPAEEVWVVQARPDLRRIQIEGAQALDPRQTRLPGPWQRLPTYLLSAGESLRLIEIARGAQGSDRLTLDRELWLDFDGNAFSLRDRIQGELRHLWRLEAEPALRLGQVRIDDEPQFITRLPGEPGREGIEVRQGQLNLLADARLEIAQLAPLPGVLLALPASGWAMPLERLSVRLNLPPGWDLLAAQGMDNLPASWLARWSLLDLFLVLIVTLAVGRLYGWHWGALALLALTLSWQEAGAPRTIWLHLLAALALLRVLPREHPKLARLRALVRLYYGASLLILTLVALSFLVGALRDGLFPQLERDGGLDATRGLYEEALPVAPLASMADLERSAQQAKELTARTLAAPADMPAARPLPRLDPQARVQTGAGVPNWHWQQVRFDWSGPVAGDHQIRLWLLPPAGKLGLAVAQLLLITALALRLARAEALPWQRPGARPMPPAASAHLLLWGLAGGLATGLLLAPAPGLATDESPAAAFPPPALLDELRTRLLEPPDCLPQCASIGALSLDLDEERLHLELSVDAAVALALPIPGGANAWRPQQIEIDGQPLDALRQDAQGRLLLPLPEGRHRLTLSAPLSGQSGITLPLPLRPQRLSARLAPGWTLEGLDAQGRPAEQLHLSRAREADPTQIVEAEGPLTEAALAPLIEVRRTLRLGLDWSIDTEIERLSAPTEALSLRVPLLPGEAVTSAERQIDAKGMLVTLPPGRSRDGWRSTLKPVDRLSLMASRDPALSEVWRIELSPLWHLDTQGLEPVQRLDAAARWLPTWRPWPGERLELHLSRPLGVPGPTLTLDASRYELSPSQRGVKANLSLTLRASQGGPHRLHLPVGAEPRLLRIDGREQPLPRTPLDAPPEIEIPLVPGTQEIELGWREPQALGFIFRPSSVDLGVPGVNAETRIQLGADRWILWTSGPLMGPAVQFWGLLLVLALFAAILARSRLTPLGTLDWFLLGVGLSQAGLWVGALVALWLIALGARQRSSGEAPAWRFNLTQVGLVVLTLIALAALLVAIQQGLLGSPRMQLAGNGSTPGDLRWSLDRNGPETASVTLVSVSIWVYRALMLAWSLWLALRLLDWLRWGWRGFAEPVLWRETRPSPRKHAGVDANHEEELRLDV